MTKVCVTTNVRKSKRTLTALSRIVADMNEKFNEGKTTGQNVFISRAGIKLQCKKRNIIGQPYIRGLFAAQLITKGTLICESDGEIVEVKPGTQIQTIPRGEGEYLRSTDNPNKFFKSFAATTAFPLNLINAASINEGEPEANAALDHQDDLHGYCYALRDIQKGEEILMSYGSDFDDMLRDKNREAAANRRAKMLANLRPCFVRCTTCNRAILSGKFNKHTDGHRMLNDCNLQLNNKRS